jgi:hypothetical protein
MADVQYSWINDALHFIDVLEDDRSKLSLTKVGAWLGMLANYGNMVVQFFAVHTNIDAIALTMGTHLITAVKHEFKRKNDV